MAYFKVSLAGDLGSGKSTVGAILKERFYADVVSVGKIQREMAEKLGMNTKEFNIYQEKHPELDKQLDDMLASYENKEGSFILVRGKHIVELFRARSACISNVTPKKRRNALSKRSARMKNICPTRTLSSN